MTELQQPPSLSAAAERMRRHRARRRKGVSCVMIQLRERRPRLFLREPL
jgi:hypothetical protein